MSALVELRDVSVHYGSDRRDSAGDQSRLVRALDGVSLSIAQGEALGLVGTTGSGKTTVAQLIMGMVRPTSGTVIVNGNVPTEASTAERRRVQIVLQDPYSSLDPRMKVGDIIAEPLTLGLPMRRDRATIRDRIAELLTFVGLAPSRAALYPHQFSGGQRQRIAIARALASHPDIIVLDEPTSALDVSVRAQILTLLKSLTTEFGVTYLVISHDLVTVAYLSSNVAVMHQGRIVEQAPTRAIYEAPLHPYTRRLLDSAPTATSGFMNLSHVEPTDAAALPPTACRYAARCVRRVALGSPSACLEEDPALQEVSSQHSVACHFPHAGNGDLQAAVSLSTEPT